MESIKKPTLYCLQVPLLALLLLAGCGMPEMHRAAQDGELTTIKRLITKEQDANRPYGDYNWTPLHYAAWNGRVEIVEYLVNNTNVDINVQTSDGCTALYLATQKDHEKIVEILLSRNADTELKLKGQWTPLLKAAYDKKWRLCELLVRAGANVNAKFNNGDSVLSRVILSEHVPTIKLLLAHGADSGDAERARIVVGKLECQPLAELIIKAGPPTQLVMRDNGAVVVNKWDPKKSQEKYLPQIKALLKQGVNPNLIRISGHRPAVSYSSSTSNSEGSIFRSLSLGGSTGELVGKDDEGQTLLEFCREHELLRIAELLEEYGAN